MPFIDDPNAEARSLMMRAPCVCSGEKNGVRCKHYWALMQKFLAANADTIRDGKKRRNCTMVESFMLEFDDKDSPTYCQRYEPMPAPGLVNIVRRAARHVTGTAPKAGELASPTTPNALGRLLGVDPKSASGFVGYDDRFEAFRPMTLEEIEKNREENPDRPVAFDQFRFSGLRGGAQLMSPDSIAKDGVGIIPTQAAQAIREEAARLVQGGMEPEAALLKAMEPKMSSSVLSALDGEPEPEKPQ